MPKNQYQSMNIYTFTLNIIKTKIMDYYNLH